MKTEKRIIFFPLSSFVFQKYIKQLMNNKLHQSWIFICQIECKGFG
jgi:hypothetical protein